MQEKQSQEAHRRTNQETGMNGSRVVDEPRHYIDAACNELGRTLFLRHTVNAERKSPQE